MDQDQDQVQWICSLFVLETAINTYVDQAERHKVFDTDTDLLYPPDNKRFLTWLENSVRAAMAYLDRVAESVVGKVERRPEGELDLELWKRAGLARFAYLKKD